jgi:uncharacterized protein YneF (UPF0154 family)
MFTLLTFFIGILLGFVGGALVVRKHFDKLKSSEDKGKALLDALKGK